jgi:hypothetical protein
MIAAGAAHPWAERRHRNVIGPCAKLKAARIGKKATTGKCEGRKGYAEAMPETVALAKQLHTDGLSYRKISAALAAQGHTTGSGKPHVASAVQKMLGHLPMIAFPLPLRARNSG